MSRTLQLLMALLVGWSLLLGPMVPAVEAAPSGPPIRIGSTLALTGPVAATALVGKLVGEIYIDQLNRKNGLLGRPVEWVVLDDQSKPDLTRSLYERLITVDKVDLLMAPYGTAAILSAMAVAQRYQKVLISATFGLPQLSTYEMHFAAFSPGLDFDKFVPGMVFDALAATGKPPKTIAIVTSKFPSSQLVSAGAREVAAQRGINVVLYLEYEFGSRDFTPIAARIKAANPDLLWVGALGVDGNLLLDALKKIDYTPRGHFYVFPAPGPFQQNPDMKFALAIGAFEEHPPFTDNQVAAEFVKAYHDKATKAGLPSQNVEMQSAGWYVGWQVQEAAVTATRSLDDKVMAQWLKTNRMNSIIGERRFDGPQNFAPSDFKLMQLQEGRRVIVWPKEWAAPGARVIYPRP